MLRELGLCHIGFRGASVADVAPLDMSRRSPRVATVPHLRTCRRPLFRRPGVPMAAIGAVVTEMVVLDTAAGDPVTPRAVTGTRGATTDETPAATGAGRLSLSIIGNLDATEKGTEVTREDRLVREALIVMMIDVIDSGIGA
eukprot:GHVO01038976.1.p3 GENE.GHVO01038976.1~~GHVO01038976.1.p3  ORF type:complete len:142 (+),score=7.21 GHVO01038976.1:162-587(+)